MRAVGGKAHLTSLLAAGCFLAMGTVPAQSEVLRGPTCFGRVATIVGTSKADVIQGTPGPDVIVGLDGRDEIFGKDGDDFICGGKNPPPADEDQGRFEILKGGAGNDRISGGRGADSMMGGPGNDYISTGPTGEQATMGTDDSADGGRSSDVLIGSRGEDLLTGGAGNDILRGRGGPDFLQPGLGKDRVRGGSETGAGDIINFSNVNRPVRVDLYHGTSSGHGMDDIRGIENVFGSEADDVLIGDDHDNLLFGHEGNDVLKGLLGDDCLFPFLGNNEIDGGEGFDFYSADPIFACRLSTYPGDFSPLNFRITVDLEAGTAVSSEETTSLVGIEGIYGTSGDDDLRGDALANEIYAGAGNDTLNGEGGDDILDGGVETDTIDGGEGTDMCHNGELVVGCE